jgi:hypothetical protein
MTVLYNQSIATLPHDKIVSMLHGQRVIYSFKTWRGIEVTTNEWSNAKRKYAKQRKVFVE